MKTEVMFYDTGFQTPDMNLLYEFRKIETVVIRERSLGHAHNWTREKIEIRKFGSDFEEFYDLSKETDGKLTNAKLKELAKKNRIDIPQNPYGTLYSLLVIFYDNEPLIFYPQMKNGKKITIDEFLSWFKDGKIKSLASKNTSEVLAKALTSFHRPP